MDVERGNRSVFSTQPFEDERSSVCPRREVKDQQQVALLKQKPYALAAHDLIASYARNP